PADLSQSTTGLPATVIPIDVEGVYVFFFFQAEDGIRDRNVTGVQTCALPISFVNSNILSGIVNIWFLDVTTIRRMTPLQVRRKSPAPCSHPASRSRQR